MEETVKLTTVTQMIDQIELSFKLRKEYEGAKRKSDLAYAEFQASSQKAAQLLEGLGLDKFHTPSGTFSYQYEETYKVPKTPEQREAFFEFLRSKGVYEDMVSVNARTLNSFAKTEETNAIAEGNFDFKIPGLEKSTPVLRPIMRKT